MDYFLFPIALIHFVQAKTRFPEGNLTHCKLGYFLDFLVGLYFPRSFFSLPTIIDDFAQIAHCLAIYNYLIKNFNFVKYLLRLIIITINYGRHPPTTLQGKIMDYLFFIAILIFSIVIHEVSHGTVANALGDPTAKYAGRLTLNPIKHLDPVGSIILPIFLIFTTGKGIGWAKPVPINPNNFRDQKYGSFKVALAGPVSNLIVALIFGLLLRVLLSIDIVSLNLYAIFSFIVFVNILLAVFNLIPIPPLDGSHILFTFLPFSAQRTKIFLNQFGFFILIFLIFLFPPFFKILNYLVNGIFTFIVGVPPL